jgi:iron complex outermembrane receptor protein
MITSSRAVARAAGWQLAVPCLLNPAPLALAVLGACLAPMAAAHTHLDPQIITSEALDAPVKVVTDPKLPRQPAPASDAGDYLLSIPGFSSVRGGGSNSDPVFRGMFGSRLNMLANGGQMLGACPSRMDSPSSYILPQSYDLLTVIKGPQAVLWGPGGSAATILFEREPESFTQFGTRLDGSLQIGSDGRFERNIDAAMGASEGYLRALATRSEANDYSDGNGDRVHSQWDKWSSDLVLGWTLGEDSLLELSLSKSDGEAAYAGRGMDGTQFDRESVALRFEQDNIGEVLEKIEARFFYNYADHVMDNFRLRMPSGMGMMAGPLATQVDRRTLGGRLATTWSWGDYQLVTGVDAQSNEHRRRSSTNMGGVFVDADRYSWSKDADFHNYGLFAELTRQLQAGSRLIGGARIDRASAKDFRIGATEGETRSDSLPSAFLRYEHDLADLPATSYIGLGHSQRFPDYWELFSPNRGALVGSSAFDTVRPEKTTQLDFGVQYKDGPLELWASGYVGQVRDYIMFTYVPGMMGMTTSIAENIDARIMGAELGGSWRLASNWRTDASLAYAWGKNSSDDRAMPQIPPLEARLGLTYERDAWSAGALWRVVAAQNRIAEGQGNVTSRDFGESSGFGVFSLNAGYRVNDNLKFSTGIDNLFDRAYSEHLNLGGNAGFGYAADTRINEPGRSWWARMDVSF